MNTIVESHYQVERYIRGMEHYNPEETRLLKILGVSEEGNLGLLIQRSKDWSNRKKYTIKLIKSDQDFSSEWIYCDSVKIWGKGLYHLIYKIEEEVK